jgi:hypothetical protein
MTATIDLSSLANLPPQPSATSWPPTGSVAQGDPVFLAPSLVGTLSNINNSANLSIPSGASVWPPAGTTVQGDLKFSNPTYAPGPNTNYANLPPQAGMPWPPAYTIINN